MGAVIAGKNQLLRGYLCVTQICSVPHLSTPLAGKSLQIGILVGGFATSPSASPLLPRSSAVLSSIYYANNMFI